MTQIKGIKQQIEAITGNTATAEAMRPYIGNPSLDARSIEFWEDALVSVQGYFARETQKLEPKLISVKGLDKTLEHCDVVAVLQECFSEIAPGYPANPVIHEVVAHDNRLEIAWGFTQKRFHSVNVSYQVVEEITGKVLMEDQIVVPEIEIDNVVEFQDNMWRVSATLSKSDTVLIENLTRIERRYVKVNVLKLIHFDYREYLKLESIQVDSVVKIEEVLYRVIQRDNDKLILENGGGINSAAYIGEVEFVHKNYQEYALLPIESEASREYSWRLTQVASDICDAADKLAIALKIYEQMTDNISKLIDIQVMWATSDGKLASQHLLDAVDSFEIALNEYQEVGQEV